MLFYEVFLIIEIYLRLNNLDILDANWACLVVLKPGSYAIAVTSFVMENVATWCQFDHF